MQRTTESESHYQELEQQSMADILHWMNEEDKKVPLVIESILPDIEKFVAAVLPKLQNGGRMFYMGSGTSGRLGVVDASELPPTFGVAFEKVIGIIAGGDGAIRKAVEGAEDDTEQGWRDLEKWNISENDVVLGIAASGTTPYVIGAMKKCREHKIMTGCITCNAAAPLIEQVDFPIVAVVGPEFITGSTRLKAGTAQKLILNMISTSLMIKLGHVKGNKMVDMQLSNAKLVDRGTRMIMAEIDKDYEFCKDLLLKYGSVRKAVDNYLI
ncbi:MAG: N-acetylmuramic acid 6-phosphate etherase [Chitinophagales bacterium]|nr:N-acetylmuramic acid 6-phosphate etherase [Chitinophagales bacterium]